MDVVNKELARAGTTRKPFRTMGDRIKQDSITLLGEVSRRDQTDPIRQVTLDSDSLNIPERNRVGRPVGTRAFLAEVRAARDTTVVPAKVAADATQL